MILIQEETNNVNNLTIQQIMEETMLSIRPNIFYRLYLCISHIYKILSVLFIIPIVPIILTITLIRYFTIFIFIYQFILDISIYGFLKYYIYHNKKNIQMNKNIKFITASCDNKIVGFFSIQSMSKNKLWISYMFILPKYHRKGIGTQLIEYLYYYGKKNGYDRFSFGTSTILNNQIKMIKKFTDNNEYKITRTVNKKWYLPINEVHCEIYKHKIYKHKIQND